MSNALPKYPKDMNSKMSNTSYPRLTSNSSIPPYFPTNLKKSENRVPKKIALRQ